MSEPLVVVTSPVVQAVGDTILAALVGPLADWKVLDSVDPRQAFESRSVTVGGTWDPEVGDSGALTAEGTVVTETVETGAGRRITETTTIQCLAYSGTGGGGFAEHRQEINAALAAIRLGLNAIRTIDGAAARAMLATQSWTSVADASGTGAMALFSVVVTVLP